MLVNATIYKDGVKSADSSFEDIEKHSKSEDTFLWISLNNPSKNEMAHLGKLYNLKEMSMTEVMDGRLVGKLEEDVDGFFLVLKIPEFREKKLVFGTLCIFVKKNVVLSILIDSTYPFHKVRHRCERESHRFKMSASFVVYTIIDTVVDKYFPLVHRFELKLAKVEADIFSTKSETRANIYRLYNLRQRIAKLKNIVNPLLEILFKLHGGRNTICYDMRDHFREVFDHLKIINTSVDNLRDTIHTAISVSLSLVTIEDNEITKRLGAWAALFAVPTSIAALWGMNFNLIKPIEEFGYPVAFFVILLVCVFLFIKFKKHKWL